MRKISQWIITIYDRKTYEKRDSFFVLYAVIVSLAGFTFNPMGVATAQLKATLEGHTNVVWSVAFSPDGQILASGSWDQTVRLWDVETEQLLHTLSGHTNEVLSVAFSPEGGTLVSSDWDGTIRLWNPETGKLKKTLTEHRVGVGSVVFSPDGTRLASGCADQTVRLWNTTTWQVERMLTGHTSVVDVVAFSPDGATLASGSRDGTIRLWDPNTGTHTTTFTIESEVNRLAFSPDGETLASGSADQTVRLWNAHTGEIKTTLPNQGGWTSAVAFSPDGATLAIANAGVSLWDTDTEQYKRPLIEYIGGVASVVFSPDGQMVASGGRDNLVRLWDFTLSDYGLNLNVGAPRTVRLIYFLPNDRPYQAEVVQRMKDEIRTVQTFFADQMEAHGYGRLTFRVETDSQGEPIVHRVDGKYPDSHYLDNTEVVYDELREAFNYGLNIYLIVTELVDRKWGGIGWVLRKQGGVALIAGSRGWYIVAHELGHAFGLGHDFRDGEYIMSYGHLAGSEPSSEPSRLSACHAENLSVHPYFNPDIPVDVGVRPAVELISPHSYPSDSKSVSIRVRVSDPDGLHQVILHAFQPDNRTSVKACRGLEGRNKRVIEFDYDGVIPSSHDPDYSRSTSLLNPLIHLVYVEIIDTDGNLSGKSFTLFSEALEPLTKISGDNLQGLPNTPLHVPFVVELRDLNNGFPRHEVWVTFTVTAGGGTLSVERVKTDKADRAESTLTLGPNFGTNTVEVSAAGIEGMVTFNAVAEAAVDIPDQNLRAAIETTLGKASGAPITTSEMETLTHLEARNANISDLTGLEHATNLTELYLGAEWVEAERNWKTSNSVSNLSPLAGLTNLATLDLRGNNISDLSPLAGLNNLTWLELWDNRISDISPLAGLTNLTELRLGGNSISNLSPLTGLTNLATLLLQRNSCSNLSPLSGLTNLTRLGLAINGISNLSPLAGLTNLAKLVLIDNAISDLSPLVANTGLGSGDTVDVRQSRLSYQSLHTHIPALQSRGVTVEFDNRTHWALLKISGDNQNGASFVPLSHPFVVEVQDANGSALAGISVRFAIVVGGGTLSTTITRTDANGRAESTLTLGPNLGTNTVKVSATGIESPVIFHAISDNLPTEYLWSIPAGMSLIHVPLQVTTIDGVAQTLISIADLYDALGGAEKVNFLVTRDAAIQRWRIYFGSQNRGTSGDQALTDDLGIIAAMKDAVTIRLGGDSLGRNGNSTITLHRGTNLVGMPLRSLSPAMRGITPQEQLLPRQSQSRVLKRVM